MKKKQMTAILLAASMVLGATACGCSGGTKNTNENTEQDQAQEQQKSGSDATELTLLMGNDWVDESTELGAEFTKVIRQYEEAHPEIKITLQGASQQDIKESFQTAALAGGGADIVTMDNSGHAIDLAAMGLLYPLSELTSAEELISQYQEGPLNSGKFQGEYHSVPWYMDCCGFYYNAERLKELDLEVPGTWEELADTLKVVKDAGYGGIITYQSAYAFYSFFYQNECPVQRRGSGGCDRQ